MRHQRRIQTTHHFVSGVNPCLAAPTAGTRMMLPDELDSLNIDGKYVDPSLVHNPFPSFMKGPSKNTTQNISARHEKVLLDMETPSTNPVLVQPDNNIPSKSATRKVSQEEASLRCAAPPQTSAMPLFDIPNILGPEGDQQCKYIRLEPIGKGSFAQAWVVERREDKRHFAAKLLVMTNAERAQREVQCLQSCRHFACMGYVEHFQFEQKLLIVMEYCDAGDLASLIVGGQRLGRNPFNETTIAIIILQLVLALEHMHSRKIIHRDIKSQNVFLSTTGLVKVGDFGLSNEYETVSGDVANTFCGTPYYLAPEVWMRQRYGVKADVWALGVLSYELITGRRPFVGKSLQSLLDAIVNRPYPELTTEKYNVSAELIDTVAAMLVKDPQQRPTTLELLARPYLRKHLNTFVRTCENTDRVDPKLKEQIRRDVVEVERSLAKNDLSIEEDLMSQTTTYTSNETDGSSSKYKEGYIAAHVKDPTAHHCRRVDTKTSTLMDGLPVVAPIPSLPQQKCTSVRRKGKRLKQKSPEAAGGEENNNGIPGCYSSENNPNQAFGKVLFEGPVRKLKGDTFRHRYLVLTPDSIHQLQGVTLDAPITLDVKGHEGEEEGGEVQHNLNELDTRVLFKRANSATAPPSPATNKPSIAHKKSSPLSLSLINRVEIHPKLPFTFVIHTTTSYSYIFEANDSAEWVEQVNEALRCFHSSSYSVSK